MKVLMFISVLICGTASFAGDSNTKRARLEIKEEARRPAANVGEVVGRVGLGEIVRIIDPTTNTVCYVAGGATAGAGTAINCLPYPR